MQEHSVYCRIASALTVIQVAEPIRWHFEVGTKLQDAYDQTWDDQGRSGIMLVTRDGSPTGFLDAPFCFDADQLSLCVEDLAHKIEIWQVVSAETSLFDLIPLWDRSYYYFVLDGTQLSHFVARHDMDKAAVKAALFALTAELEERMLRLLIADQDRIAERFERLNSKSQKKARYLSKKKNLPDAPLAHIQNTFFPDKVQMFLATPELTSLLPFANESEAESYFEFIGRMRNELAHGGSIFNIIKDASELKSIVDLTEDVILHLKEQG